MNSQKAASSSLTDLRALLQARFPTAMPPAESGPCFEARGLMEVTLLRGKMVEIVSCAGGGPGLLLLTLAASGHAVALVDGMDSFDPASAGEETRQRLLWVRCRQAREAVRAADLLLRDGNLPTVILDLRLLPQRELSGLPASVWHRLRMLAERADAAVAVFSPCRVVSCAARRWSLDTALGLEALETGREALASRLRPRLQQGTVSPEPWSQPQPDTGPLAIAS